MGLPALPGRVRNRARSEVSGAARAGGAGAGTPAMTGVGRGTVQVIQDGRWIVLDCEQDQFLPDGTFVLKWQLHWVSGWSPEHGE